MTGRKNARGIMERIAVMEDAYDSIYDNTYSTPVKVNCRQSRSYTDYHDKYTSRVSLPDKGYYTVED